MANKDVEELRRQAIQQGWVVTSGTLHYKFHPPETENAPPSGFITVSKTPRGQQVIKNIKADLKRCGFQEGDKYQAPETREERNERQSIDGLREGLTRDDMMGPVSKVLRDLNMEDAPMRVRNKMLDLLEYHGISFENCTCGAGPYSPGRLLYHLATQHLKEAYEHQPIGTTAANELRERLEAARIAEGAVESSAPITLDDNETDPESAEKSALLDRTVEDLLMLSETLDLLLRRQAEINKEIDSIRLAIERIASSL